MAAELPGPLPTEAALRRRMLTSRATTELATAATESGGDDDSAGSCRSGPLHDDGGASKSRRTGSRLVSTTTAVSVGRRKGEGTEARRSWNSCELGRSKLNRRRFLNSVFGGRSSRVAGEALVTAFTTTGLVFDTCGHCETGSPVCTAAAEL